MDNATNNDLEQCDLEQCDLDECDLDEWWEISHAEKKAKRTLPTKKHRKSLRKNRKPSRPVNYIGQRSNNHLLRIFK